ncbi:NAD(P)-dependent oxidoreductase [Comamonadaceae bacterium M7527]|nr:NAD(P)-dependent oxidoreductase [Comamonadaceae bacterium M7527]
MHANTMTMGFVGVGNMGMGMLTRWRHCGHTALACDVDGQRTAQASALGAQVFDTPAALAKALPQSALLVVCVVDASQCEEVLFEAQTGAAQHLKPGHTVLLTPTLSPNDVQAIGHKLQAMGLHMLDAPMSGGPVRAAQGTMSLMVSGPTRQAWWPTLEVLEPVFDLGGTVGDAAKTKLVNNLLAGMNLVASAQATHLAQAVGLDANRTWDVIERSSGGNWIGSDRMRRALAGDDSVKAHMRLLAKDTRLAMDMAQAAGLQPAMGHLAAALFAQALDMGWVERDDSAMLALHQLPS